MPVRTQGANVRASELTYRKLTKMAEKSGLSLQCVLETAVETYRRQTFLEGLNADFAALRAQPEKCPPDDNVICEEG